MRNITCMFLCIRKIHPHVHEHERHVHVPTRWQNLCSLSTYACDHDAAPPTHQHDHVLRHGATGCPGKSNEHAGYPPACDAACACFWECMSRMSQTRPMAVYMRRINTYGTCMSISHLIFINLSLLLVRRLRLRNRRTGPTGLRRRDSIASMQTHALLFHSHGKKQPMRPRMQTIGRGTQ